MTRELGKRKCFKHKEILVFGLSGKFWVPTAPILISTAETARWLDSQSIMMGCGNKEL